VRLVQLLQLNVQLDGFKGIRVCLSARAAQKGHSKMELVK